jgi:hypothetical protein
MDRGTVMVSVKFKSANMSSSFLKTDVINVFHTFLSWMAEKPSFQASCPVSQDMMEAYV